MVNTNQKKASAYSRELLVVFGGRIQGLDWIVSLDPCFAINVLNVLIIKYCSQCEIIKEGRSAFYTVFVIKKFTRVLHFPDTFVSVVVQNILII